MWTGEQTNWLHTPQRYERIAARLAEEVRSGALRPGARLPAERELAKRLEVSRSSVREAIASLALEGVVETRPGSGTYVAADGPERARALGDRPAGAEAGDIADASPSALLEARLAFEPQVVTLAAARGQRDPAAEGLIERMEGLVDVTTPEGRDAWNDADRRFHLQLARMTHNPVLEALAEVVATLMDQPLWQALRDESVSDPAHLALAIAEHRLIYEAVAEGDAEAARFHVTKHLQRVRRFMTLD